MSNGTDRNKALDRKKQKREAKEDYVTQQGRKAFRAGEPLSKCPYGQDFRSHGKAHSWRRGWERERDGK